MTMPARLTALLGAVLLAGALAATFTPATGAGSDCGTWLSPDWSDTATADVVARAERVAADARAVGDGATALRARGIRDNALAARTACADTLSTRRTLALVLLLAAVTLPAGALWVARGGPSRHRTDTDPLAPTHPTV